MFEQPKELILPKESILPKKSILPKESINNDIDEDTCTLTKQEILDLVLIIDKYDYDIWIKVGMCLFNIDKNYLDIWIEWSKKDIEKFNNGECDKKWNGFKLDKLGVGTLIMLAKELNFKQYTIFYKKKLIADFLHNIVSINEKKNIYINNKLEVSNIIVTDTVHYIELKDKHCPISNTNHEGHLYYEITPYEHTLKCLHIECKYKKYPHGHQKLNNKEINNFFNITQNITINNNYNSNNDNDDIFIPICDNIFEDNVLNGLIYNGLKHAAHDIGVLFVYLIKDNLIFTGGGEWYFFDKHRWISDNCQREIPLYISINIVNLYDQVVSFYNKSLTSNKNDSVNYMYKKHIKQTQILLQLLKTPSYQMNVIKVAESLITRKNRERNLCYDLLLDGNPYLIGFDNGIYDLKKMEFRDGTPLDYVTLSVGYNYIDNYTDEKRIIKFFEDIQPDKQDREYLLTLLGSCLEHNNSEEKFNIFSGTGRNGKTMVDNMLINTFGKYHGTMDSTMLTSAKPSANTPQM